jgi:hypothetical protein
MARGNSWNSIVARLEGHIDEALEQRSRPANRKRRRAFRMTPITSGENAGLAAKIAA